MTWGHGWLSRQARESTPLEDVARAASCQKRGMISPMRPPFYWLLTVTVSPFSRGCLLQSLIDLPNEWPTLFPVGHRRLLDEQLLQFRLAIAGVVALRPAAVVFEELLVGIVDAAVGIVKANLLVFAGELGESVGGLYRFEFAVAFFQPNHHVIA
jgi:hypothetical protein